MFLVFCLIMSVQYMQTNLYLIQKSEKCQKIIIKCFVVFKNDVKINLKTKKGQILHNEEFTPFKFV